jgi:4-amino-4-deoxy-L-arabinose transferase-like glycosyltransferase
MMKRQLPILVLILVFLIFKISNLDIRLSDSNIYFYTGQQLLSGQVLYRDIFFTNFPLLPYLSALYFFISGGNLSWFFLTPALEAGAVAFLIYLIIYKKQASVSLALISSFIYLFSFIILSTSDHQSGVFFASLLALLAYYFYLGKKYLISGVFVALAFLTKAYFIPIVLTFLAVFVFSRKWKELLRFAAGGAISGVVIMLPTLFFAFPDFFKNVFEYSLTRSQGVGKSNIFWFFVTHDFVLFVLLAFSLINIGKNKFLGFISVFGILFFIFYQDIYYLYLNFLVPFLALSFSDFYKSVQKIFSLQKAILPTILAPFLLYGVIVYWSDFRDLQRLSNYSEIVQAVKDEEPAVLYGVNDIAPALSYSSGVPLLNGIIDTNANIYRKGILNAEKLTEEAVAQKGIIIAHGLSYPAYGVEEEVVDEIFDKEMIEKSCKLIKSFPIKMEGPENRLNLLRCY